MFEESLAQSISVFLSFQDIVDEDDLQKKLNIIQCGIQKFRAQVNCYCFVTVYKLTLPQYNYAPFILSQLTSGDVHKRWPIQTQLRSLYSLILASDVKKLSYISSQLGLPHTLFDIIHDTVEEITLKEVNAHKWIHIQRCNFPVSRLLNLFILFSKQQVCQH